MGLYHVVFLGQLSSVVGQYNELLSIKGQQRLFFYEIGSSSNARSSCRESVVLLSSRNLRVLFGTGERGPSFMSLIDLKHEHEWLYINHI